MLPPGTEFSKLNHCAKLLQIWCFSDPAGPGGGIVRGAMEPVLSHQVESAISQRAAGGRTPTPEKRTMTILKWALIFFLVSIVAGILGFTGISAASADVARFLFYVFVVIFLVLLILGLTVFRV
jgi:uncharacterized membrane protein YtjA (UPF0391 family)